MQSPGDLAVFLLGRRSSLPPQETHDAALWALGRVDECGAGTKQMTHPTAGEIIVDLQLWAQADRPEQRLEVYELRSDEGNRSRSRRGATTPVFH